MERGYSTGETQLLRHTPTGLLSMHLAVRPAGPDLGGRSNPRNMATKLAQSDILAYPRVLRTNSPVAAAVPSHYADAHRAPSIRSPRSWKRNIIMYYLLTGHGHRPAARNERLCALGATPLSCVSFVSDPNTSEGTNGWVWVREYGNVDNNVRFLEKLKRD